QRQQRCGPPRAMNFSTVLHSIGAIMTRLEIIYNLPFDRSMSLNTLASHCEDFKIELSDAERLNYARIHVVKDGSVVCEAQPYSLSVLLTIITKHFRLILSGASLWLDNLESSILLQTSG